MNHAFTTTAFELTGYRTGSTFGVVRGITVRSRSIVGSFVGGLQTIVGGNITIYTELCERARGDAFELMTQPAGERAPSPMVGVRSAPTEIMAAFTEVLCYATAVLVEPVA